MENYFLGDGTLFVNEYQWGLTFCFQQIIFFVLEKPVKITISILAVVIYRLCYIECYIN